MAEIFDSVVLKSPIFSAFSRSIDQQYIYICDIKTNIWRWSKPAIDYFGLPGEYIKDLPVMWMDRVHPDDREKLAEEFEQLFSGQCEEHACEYRVKNASGDYVWVLCHGCMVRNQNGEMDVCAGILTNIGSPGKFDSVTGLPGTQEFRTALATAASDQKASGAVLLLGIDHFRKINDENSYEMGNKLLRAFAEQLVKLTPEGVVSYRMDSDKFAVVYPEADEKAVSALFERFVSAAASGFLVDGKKIPFTISAGAILYPLHTNEQSEVYNRLEYAFEFAKKNRREGLVFFSDDIREEILHRYQLLQNLKESIKNNFEGFYLCYQPLISAEDPHEVQGAETLIRWFHKDYGVVSPGDFIGLLEESGDILEVGKWVLAQAIAQFKKWQQYKPHLKVSVNVAIPQFKDENFKYFVLEQIEKNEYPAKKLVLELTESCKIIHPEKVNKDLSFFREHGIQIALDDFGTGYASLSLLRQIQADWIKVDQTFVSQIADNAFDQALTASLIDLCKKLGLSVCVEGIETKEVETVISSFKPTLLQGYYYSKPVKASLFEKLYVLTE